MYSDNKIPEFCPVCGGTEWEQDIDDSNKGYVIFKRYCIKCGYKESLDKVSDEDMDKDYEKDMNETDKDDDE